MCGIIGAFSKNNTVSRKLFYGLNCLQHRGQESCGISVSDFEDISKKTGMGLVMDVLKEDVINGISGYLGIGHVRYSTAGGSWEFNSQPLLGFTKGEKISLAHNGNLINYQLLRSRLEEDGMVFHTTIDTEVILYLIARFNKGDIVDAIKKTMGYIEGAYSLVIMFRDKLIAVRDPNGFRPLVIGSTNEDLVVASESSAIEILGGKTERDVKPGEIIVIDKDGMTSFFYEKKAKHTFCIFEHIYFSRNDATVENINAYMFRWRSGKLLFKDAPCDVDLVIPVPDSGIPSAIGFSQASGIPFAEGLVKNRYMGRTFIKPTQEERELAVKFKLNPLISVVKGKKLVLIDDSIVRGTTSKNLIKNLRDAGALEVHMRITSPPVTHPCYFGIDTASRRNLIAAHLSVEEIRDLIGADTLEYLSEESLLKAAKTSSDHFCKACFNGDYPVDPCVLI